MKAEILKIAGVKNEKEFYKKFPTEEAFMAKHGKKLKKAVNGFEGLIKPPAMPKVEMTNLADTKGFGLTKLNTPGKSPNRGFDWEDLAGTVTSQLGPLIGNIQQIGQENKDIANARKYAQISDLTLQAASSRPEQTKRKYLRPEDQLTQTVNPLGVGTNYLAAENGAEIANYYSSPDTIYTDGGFEPLNDSNVKQYKKGGKLKKADGGLNLDPFAGVAGGLGGALGSATGKGSGKGGAASSIGSTIGGIAGSFLPIPGVGTALGSLVGGFAGGLFDAGRQNELQEAEDKLNKNLQASAFQSGAQNIQSQNKGFMEEGGWVSHDWQPQVITKFGEYNVSELLKPPHDADMLRAGGHLKEYTAPSERAMYTGREQFAMGGDLQVERGKAETMSYNPYLPEGGETVMFRGPSHEDGGMPISYGENGVEVEGGEPAVIMKNGGEADGNLVVFGNMAIPEYGIQDLGKEAKGKKFKNYIADLSKVEAKQGKILDKSSSAIDEIDGDDQFDQLAINANHANMMGANMKLKDIADKKKTAAALQNAILDTAEELGVESDALAKGKMKLLKENSKYAKFGAKLETAADGKSTDPNDSWINKILNYESKSGSGAGTGLSNFGYNTRNPKTKEEAIKYFKEDYLPKVDYLPQELKGRAADWIFNTGKDPRIPLLLAAGKVKSNAFGPAADRLELASDPALLEERWNEHSDEILKKAKDPSFLKKFDTARKVMYQNIKKGPSGEINPAYTNTWKNRTNIFSDDYAGLTNNVTPTTQSAPTAMVTAAPTQQGNFSNPMLMQQLIPEQSGSGFIPNLADQITQARINDREKNNQLLDEVSISAKKNKSSKSIQMPVNIPLPQLQRLQQLQDSGLQDLGTTDIKDKRAKGKSNWWETGLNALESSLPYLRPSDAEALDPKQLAAEIYRLQDQVQPVKAQLYNPMLQAQPYRISLQDQLNEVTAQTRSAERMAQGNPAALAMIAAQGEQAKTKILGDQFRMNQAEQARAAETNRAQLNDAQLKNLAILDQQYERQEKAKSIDRTNKELALNSIASKFAKNKLDNRTLGVMENMYNYRFGPNGQVYNMNPTARFNQPNVGYGASSVNQIGAKQTPKELRALADLQEEQEKKATKSTKRNGAIVKAIKNL